MYLRDTSRQAVTAWLDTHYRHCTVTQTYVMDDATGQHPLLYMDWYPPESFEREWDPAALTALRKRFGVGFEHTALIAYLSKAYGRDDNARQFATHILGAFTGLAENAAGETVAESIQSGEKRTP